MECRHVGIFDEVRISLVEADNEDVMNSRRTAGQNGRGGGHPDETENGKKSALQMFHRFL
jgi:hypothetical protein